MTSGAPWRVRVTEEDRRRLSVADSADGWRPLKGAAQMLGVSQQTVLQRIKAGELQAVRVHVRRRSAWRILVPEKTQDQTPLLLFDRSNSWNEQQWRASINSTFGFLNGPCKRSSRIDTRRTSLTFASLWPDN